MANLRAVDKLEAMEQEWISFFEFEPDDIENVLKKKHKYLRRRRKGHTLYIYFLTQLIFLAKETTCPEPRLKYLLLLTPFVVAKPSASDKNAKKSSIRSNDIEKGQPSVRGDPVFSDIGTEQNKKPFVFLKLMLNSMEDSYV